MKEKGKRIGFVPTMGYLHEGHLSLIKRARKENEIVVVSIFVNPTQFGPREDFKKYPRNLKQDIRLSKEAGSDIIFYPSVGSMYPKGCSTYAETEGLSSFMCGLSRPAHFKGVTTICTKLFNIVRPDIAYFGQKDYQQALIIKRLASDLNMDLKIKILPIIREASGLAMSSRNNYLTLSQRNKAAILYQSLKMAKALIMSGEKSASKVKSAIRRMILKEKGFRIDYITVADPHTLKETKHISSKVLIALAAWLGKTRLIDNIIISLGRKKC